MILKNSQIASEVPVLSKLAARLQRTPSFPQGGVIRQARLPAIPEKGYALHERPANKQASRTAGSDWGGWSLNALHDCQWRFQSRATCPILNASDGFKRFILAGINPYTTFFIASCRPNCRKFIEAIRKRVSLHMRGRICAIILNGKSLNGAFIGNNFVHFLSPPTVPPRRAFVLMTNTYYHLFGVIQQKSYNILSN